MSNFKIQKPEKRTIWSNDPRLIPFIVSAAEIKQKYGINRDDNPNEWETYRQTELDAYKKSLIQCLPLVKGKDILALSLTTPKYTTGSPIFSYRFLDTTDCGEVFKQESFNSENVTYGIDRYNNIILEEEFHGMIRRTLFRTLKTGLSVVIENNFRQKLQNDDISSYDISQCTYAMGAYVAENNN